MILVGERCIFIEKSKQEFLSKINFLVSYCLIEKKLLNPALRPLTFLGCLGPIPMRR